MKRTGRLTDRQISINVAYLIVSMVGTLMSKNGIFGIYVNFGMISCQFLNKHSCGSGDDVLSQTPIDSISM